jgi:hypothetical protein
MLCVKVEVSKNAVSEQECLPPPTIHYLPTSYSPVIHDIDESEKVSKLDQRYVKCCCCCLLKGEGCRLTTLIAM